MYGVHGVLDDTVSGRRHAATTRRTPVFIICSPRPRVGRTLIARLLTEFFLVNDRSVAAFDANPNDQSLWHHLPDHTAVATISDTKSQMALFDRLIVNDATPKVLDLGAGLFHPFFRVMQEIGFVEEARSRQVDPVVLFMTDMHRASSEAYATILRRFARIVLVPVHNEAITDSYDSDSFPILRANGVSVRIPRLSPLLNGVIDRHGFSFANFLRKPVDFPSELHIWAHRSFVAFRELELRLRLEDFRLLFQQHT